MTSQTAAYPHLFAPLDLGKVSLQNRLVMLPHGTSMVVNGAITEDDIEYYRARARSRPGMMITGAAVVHPTSARRHRVLVENYSEHAMPGLAARAHMIRSHGVVAVGQLVHLGRESIGMESDYPLGAPSVVRTGRDPFPPHVLDEGNIGEMIAAFARCAVNLKRTGHDGVEVHAAHGYLVAQFLSPATNLRSDAYGGDPQRRFRFMRELIQAIRETCGGDFLLGIRLSADEEIADGIEIADTLRIIEQIEATAAVDYISLTLGMRGAYVKDVTQPEATAARAAGIIKARCSLPILVGQRLTRPDLAEAILRDGQADMVGMARAFIADANWVEKARAGQAERIRPCIGLNQDCRAFAPHLHCAVNPEAGRERVAPFDGAARPDRHRTIAIIGAGPAGLEAARTAALRGHTLRLFEASDSVGGQFLYAASVPHRQDLRRLIDYYQSELRRLSVQVELGRKIGTAADLSEGFDTVILATGAKAMPVPSEFAGERVMSWFDVLANGAPAPTGDRRAVMLDDGTGFWWNYGVAECLNDAGWAVTFVTPSAMIGNQIPAESLSPLLARLGRGQTRYRVLTQLFAVVDDGVQLIDLASGAVETMVCDLVVLQTGRETNSVAAAFKQTGLDVHQAGDCLAPRRMANAVFEAQRLALSL